MSAYTKVTDRATFLILRPFPIPAYQALLCAYNAPCASINNLGGQVALLLQVPRPFGLPFKPRRVAFLQLLSGRDYIRVWRHVVLKWTSKLMSC